MSDTTLLEKAANELTGIQQFPELAKKAIKVITQELKEYNLAGAGVFKIDQDRKYIYAYEYTSQYSKVAQKFLSKPSDLRIRLDQKNNYIAQAVTTNKPQQSGKLADFLIGTAVEDYADKLQKLSRSKQGIVFPIVLKNGKSVGAVFFILKKDKLKVEQFEMLQAFAKLLGIAFFNVFAFEQMMDRYKKEMLETGHPVEEEDIPSVKFTLRITPRQDKQLQEQASKKDTTKAELLRSMIDAL